MKKMRKIGKTRIIYIFLCLLLIYTGSSSQMQRHFILMSKTNIKASSETIYFQIRDQNNQVLNFENYLVYVNSTLLVTPSFTANSSDELNITVFDLTNTTQITQQNYTVQASNNHVIIWLDIVHVKNDTDQRILFDYMEDPQEGHFQAQYSLYNETNEQTPDWISIDPFVVPIGRGEIIVKENQTSTGLVSTDTKNHSKILQLYRDYDYSCAGGGDLYWGIFNIEMGNLEETCILEFWTWINTLTNYVPVLERDDEIQFYITHDDDLDHIAGGITFTYNTADFMNGSSGLNDDEIAYGSLPGGSWPGFEEWTHIKMKVENSQVTYYLNNVEIGTYDSDLAVGETIKFRVKYTGKETAPKKYLLDAIDFSTDPSGSYFEGRSFLYNYSLHSAAYETLSIDPYETETFELSDLTNYSYRIRDISDHDLEQTDLVEEVIYDRYFTQCQIAYTDLNSHEIEFSNFITKIKDSPFSKEKVLSQSNFIAEVNKSIIILTYSKDLELIKTYVINISSGINRITIEIEALKISNYSPESIFVDLEDGFHYQGAYSFDLETPNRLPTSAFTDPNLPQGTDLKVINRYLDHNKVLKFERVFNQDFDPAIFQDLGTAQSSGTIEFYFLSTLYFDEDFFEDPNIIECIFGESNGSDYNDLVQAFNISVQFDDLLFSNETVNTSMAANTWNHVRLTFNSSENYFQGWHNGNYMGNFTYFNTSGIDIDKMVISLHSFEFDLGLSQTMYFDALDFSWFDDDYYFGRNLDLNSSEDLVNQIAFPNWEEGYYQKTAINDLLQWNSTQDYLSLDNVSSVTRLNPVQDQISTSITRKDIWNLTSNTSDDCILQYNLSSETQTNNLSLELVITNASTSLNLSIEFWNATALIAGARLGTIQESGGEYKQKYYDGSSWQTSSFSVFNISEWFLFTMQIEEGELSYYTIREYFSDEEQFDFEIKQYSGTDANISHIILRLNPNESVIIDSMSLSSEDQYQSQMSRFENSTAHPLTSIRQDHIFFVPPSSVEVFGLPAGTYLYTIRDVANNILQTYNLIAENETQIDYFSEYLRSCLVILKNQRGDALEFNSFDVRKNGSRIQGELFQEVLGDSINLTVYDLFGDFIDSLEYTIQDRDNFITINLTVYSLKIVSNLNLESFTNLSKSPTEFSISQYIAPLEILTFNLLEGTYQFNYVDDSESQTSHDLTLSISADRIVILNTSWNQIYFGVFDESGLGIDRNIVRLLIENERKDFGFNLIKSNIANIKALDYFNQSLFNQDVNFSGLTEYNLFVPVYNLIIFNNYSLPVKLTIQREILGVIKFVYELGATQGTSIRLLRDVKYDLEARFLNGTIAYETTIELDEQNTIVSFGFATLAGEVSLEAVTIVDHLISLSILGVTALAFSLAGSNSIRIISRTSKRKAISSRRVLPF